ncbi:MAG: zf-HC2 domain-containing protein [Cyanobacteria bacterium]|nr:zf-HC2 domain-containing protein [Cyanobacteriota bacterium]
MNNHLSEDELILHSYGEVDRADRSRVDEHLASCAECLLAKEKLARVMTMIDTAPPVEAPLGFERTVWARLEPYLEVPGVSPVHRSASKVYDLVFGKTAREGGWLPQWALAGGVAALVIAAFVAGRFSGGDLAAPSSAAVAHVEPDRVLQSAVGDHLDRTQMMLVELANAEVDGADVLAGEQARAGDLVAANRVILRSAIQSGDGQVVDILEDLERVLLEVANAPANATSNDLTDLQSRITREDLLFRLRVIASEMRQRQIDDREAGDPTRRKMPTS